MAAHFPVGAPALGILPPSRGGAPPCKIRDVRRGLSTTRLLLPAIVAASFTPAARAGQPYEDTKKRFRIELAEHWELAPRFGDMNGMTFQRVVRSRRGEALAILLIQIDSSGASGPKEYADAVEKDLEKQPGFARLGASTTDSGRPALVREYKMLASKKPRIEKRARAHYFEARGHLYLLHFESSAAEFARLEPEAEQMMRSFTPLEPAAASGSESVRRDPDSSSKSEIAGRWTNNDGLVLILGDDGTFALADASGRYEVQGPTLTLIIPGQGRESFSFLHDAGAATLTLSSPNLGQPMTYRRATASKKSDKRPSKMDPSATRAADLAGRWTTPAPGGTLDLSLRPDKSFSMGAMKGQWSATADQLTLSRHGEAMIVYRFRIADGRLWLSGGDLEEEVVFGRRSEP